MENNRYNLGYFLEYDFWNQAIKMLDCQLKGKSKAGNKKNKKVLLPLNFKYFDKISAEYEGIINEEKYFKERIANNFFYGLDKEFFIYEYQKSKSSFGLRNYYFFSYPLILVHYCIGIYLLKLSQKFMDEIYKLNNDSQKCYVKSYYGGKLRFDFKNNSLLFNNAYERFYYLQHYKEFKMDIKKEMNDTSNKVVIKMDIANYYDNIRIRRFLYYLDECIDDETKWDLNFDEYTKDQISFFYEFIMKDKIGIPQSDNNIVSDFIGYLYLFFADMFIIDEIGRNIDVEQFKLIRYVDDIYIVLKYGEATSNVESFDYEELRKASVKVLSKTSDLLYYKFGLKLNNKTKIYLVEKEEEKKEFLKNFKKVSVDRVSEPLWINGEENYVKKKVPAKERLDAALKEVEKMKGKDFICRYYDSSGDVLDDEILKNIYDVRVSNLLYYKEYEGKICEIFKDFDFDLIRISPSLLINLILRDELTKKRFIKFILNKKESITISDRDVILELLCQLEYKNKDLIYLLSKDKYFKKILREVEEAKMYCDYPNDSKISFDCLFEMYNQDSILQQVELRSLYEREGSYSIALNHLVNEIQSICFYLDNTSKPFKDYKKEDIQVFLGDKVSRMSIIYIAKLFNRRNNNKVSHSGTNNFLSQGVTKQEYFNYKGKMNIFLREISSYSFAASGRD